MVETWRKWTFIFQIYNDQKISDGTSTCVTHGNLSSKKEILRSQETWWLNCLYKDSAWIYSQANKGKQFWHIVFNSQKQFFRYNDYLWKHSNYTAHSFCSGSGCGNGVSSYSITSFRNERVGEGIKHHWHPEEPEVLRRCTLCSYQTVHWKHSSWWGQTSQQSLDSYTCKYSHFWRSIITVVLIHFLNMYSVLYRNILISWKRHVDCGTTWLLLWRAIALLLSSSDTPHAWRCTIIDLDLIALITILLCFT